MGWFDEQIRDRKRNDDEAFAEAFANMAAAITGRKIDTLLNNDRVVTKDAIDEILRYYHVKSREVPDGIGDVNEQLEYFEQLNPKTGEVSDDELNNVAGGGCHNGDGRMITTVLNDCRHWLCKYDGETWMNTHDGFGVSTSVCKKCASSAACKNCKYCSYEKGLWLCNNPVNMK